LEKLNIIENCVAEPELIPKQVERQHFYGAEAEIFGLALAPSMKIHTKILQNTLNFLK
jgi:hypothetical protein